MFFVFALQRYELFLNLQAFRAKKMHFCANFIGIIDYSMSHLLVIIVDSSLFLMQKLEVLEIFIYIDATLIQL
jgi:hypothetical protein